MKPNPTPLRKGDVVQRYDTSEKGVVAADEFDGYVHVLYVGYSRPLLQVASKFKKVTT